ASTPVRTTVEERRFISRCRCSVSHSEVFMTEPHEAVPRGTVHIVEDDESQRRAIGRFIEASGYHVKTYESAEAFLAAATGDAPRCVLLDLRLPGPSGLGLQDILPAGPRPLPC